MALSDQATVLYLCSTPYAPGRGHGVHPLDPAPGISWPLDCALCFHQGCRRADGCPRA